VKSGTYFIGHGTCPTLSTSASGAMRSSRVATPLLPRGGLCISGTVARYLLAEALEQVIVPSLPQTSTGRSLPQADTEARSTGSAIMELRRRSGLTWEQLAELFGVARRSLHFWASGKPLNAVNEERLRRILAAICMTDRGTAAKNRAMLLEVRDGLVPLDLLTQGAYEDFIKVVGTGPGRQESKRTALSVESRAARKPQPPEELVGALQNRVHIEKGRLLSATPIRRKGKG